MSPCSGLNIGGVESVTSLPIFDQVISFKVRSKGFAVKPLSVEYEIPVAPCSNPAVVSGVRLVLSQRLQNMNVGSSARWMDAGVQWGITLSGVSPTPDCTNWPLVR